MKKILGLVLLAFSILTAVIFTPNSFAQLARPEEIGKFMIFGTAYTGDGLAPGWKNGSLYNGVNSWNIIDKTQAYAGVHSLSWATAAPFEFGWVTGATPINMANYEYLNFYGKSTQQGQRYEVGLVDQNGKIVGNWIPLEQIGPPLQPDRWALYSTTLFTFNASTFPVYGIGFRDMNGAPQPKVFFDEIELSRTPGAAPVISQGFGVPGSPTEPPKPKGPYYPQISPWVFIIPGVIILLAIFFE